MNRSRKSLLGLAAGAVAAAALFAATGLAAAEDSELKLIAGPVPFVEEGGDGFTIAKLVNNGPSTVTQAVLEVTFTSSPVITNVTHDTSCTTVTGTSTVVVSCPLPQTATGGTASRVIRWAAPSIVSAATPSTPIEISARLAYKNDPNNDSTTADNVVTTVLNGSDGVDNVDSHCEGVAGTTASTALLPPSLGDPQTTALSYGAASLGFPCNWAVVGETAVDPAAQCGAGVACATGFWFASLPEAVGDLTLSIYELPRGASLSKFVLREFPNFPEDRTTSNIVGLCTAGSPPTLPAGVTSCEKPGTRAKLGSRGAIFQLLVKGSGRDPGYAG